jgi:hypothetical protein
MNPFIFTLDMLIIKIYNYVINIPARSNPRRGGAPLGEGPRGL